MREKDTIEPRAKLAQFKLTDAQRLAFMTEERDELLAACRAAVFDLYSQPTFDLNITSRNVQTKLLRAIERANNGRLAK